MLFSTLTFIFVFLPIVWLGHWLLKPEYRNLFLLLASLIFFFWGEPRYFSLFLLALVFNYVIAKLILHTKQPKYQTAILVTGLIIDTGALVFFKYTNFISANLANIGLLNSVTNIALPVGISFFIFQKISFLIDIYKANKNGNKPDFNLIESSLYLALFPQLIAGPIVKYHEVAKEIKHRVFEAESVQLGIERFIVGLAKKVLIADQLAAIVDAGFGTDISGLSTIESWLLVIAYALQIYFDFSGYSDMAIGLGKMFGFHFMENFNYPYISTSISEFWRRWNMSLGSWFREYIYIPLGGSRKSKFRVSMNLMLVFLLTGIWHGAAWTFIIWGIWHGVWVVIERLFLHKYLQALPKFVSILYTLIIVLVGWVYFRSTSFTQGNSLIQQMFSVDFRLDFILNWNIQIAVVMLLGAGFAIPWWRKVNTLKPVSQLHLESNLVIRNLYRFGLLGIFLISITFILGTTFNAFIYFQF